jgi:hypothetical protein
MNTAEKTDNQSGVSPTPTNKPSHIAYWVKSRENSSKGQWHPIGVAWSHADGKGITVHLDLQPLDGRITLRVAEDRKE